MNVHIREVGEEDSIQDKVLRGYPDFVILSEGFGGTAGPMLCVVIAENKSSTTKRRSTVSQLAFYMLQAQMQNLRNCAGGEAHYQVIFGSKFVYHSIAETTTTE